MMATARESAAEGGVAVGGSIQQADAFMEGDEGVVGGERLGGAVTDAVNAAVAEVAEADLLVAKDDCGAGGLHAALAVAGIIDGEVGTVDDLPKGAVEGGARASGAEGLDGGLGGEARAG